MKVFNFLEQPKGLEVLYHLFTWVYAWPLTCDYCITEQYEGEQFIYCIFYFEWFSDYSNWSSTVRYIL